MNKIKNILWCVPLLLLIVAITPVYSDIIYLKSGTSIECDSIRKGNDGYIWIKKSHGVIGYLIDEVDLEATFGEPPAETVAKTHVPDKHYSKEALARELYELSGLEKQVAQLGELSVAGLNEAYEQGGLPERFYEYLLPLARDAYNVHKIRRDLLQRIEKNLDITCIEAVLIWLQSPQGRKITIAEEAASTPEGIQRMQAFAAQLQTNPTSLRRLQLVKRLDKANNSTELMIDMATITVHGVIKELNAILPSAQRVDYYTLEQQMNAQRSQMRRSFQNVCIVSSLYTYQSLSDDELERYVEFAESDFGRRYHQTIFQEFKNIQSEAASYVGRALGKAYRDLG
jgi:hypothetical protein